MVTANDAQDEFPLPHTGDVLVEVTKSLVGAAFPGASALATLIRTQHARRLEAFHRRTAERLRALEKNNASYLLKSAIEGNQEATDEILSTYSVIARLVQEAMEQEKREALAAAMASTLLWPTDAGDIERRYFLRCLSDFEAIHINLIARARRGLHPVKELVNASGSLGETAKAAWKELNDRGLVNRESVNVFMTDSGMNADAATAQGVRFLKFIGQQDYVARQAG